MTAYINNHPDWPDFRCSRDHLADRLATVSHRQGRLIGRMESLGFALRAEAVLQTITEDVLKSSEIEGEFRDKAQVRSSIARRLGLDIGGLIPAERDVEGVVEMVLDATQNFAAPLTAERLFDWHAALFPTGRRGMSGIIVGAWRDDRTDPMQVVSGPLGRERVHYEAPAAERLDCEMRALLDWYNGGQEIDPVMKAGLAHLWFVTIHPFDDGNGRVARAIADMALARADGSAQRFYSMSAQIHRDRKAYYDTLEANQKGDLDVTLWLPWFLRCLGCAVDDAERMLAPIFRKAHFWERCVDVSLNPRQRDMVKRLLDGFVSKLTSSKWAVLTKCSQDTALRDIDGLIASGVLIKDAAGGRSTSYALAE